MCGKGGEKIVHEHSTVAHKKKVNKLERNLQLELM